MITQAQLKELLSYDPETGVFTWNVSKNAIKIGGIAGGLNSKGYWQIKINLKTYRAHRLSWLYMTGNWPEDQIDHINRNRSDNRFVNLREATQSQNQGNSKKYKDVSSVYRGACWHKRDKKWRVQIMVNGKKKWIGYFDQEEAAAAAYDWHATKVFGEFANTNGAVYVLD